MSMWKFITALVGAFIKPPRSANDLSIADAFRGSYVGIRDESVGAFNVIVGKGQKEGVAGAWCPKRL
jgi:hypothetical protein